MANQENNAKSIYYWMACQDSKELVTIQILLIWKVLQSDYPSVAAGHQEMGGKCFIDNTLMGCLPHTHEGHSAHYVFDGSRKLRFCISYVVKLSLHYIDVIVCINNSQSRALQGAAKANCVPEKVLSTTKTSNECGFCDLVEQPLWYSRRIGIPVFATFIW